MNANTLKSIKSKEITVQTVQVLRPGEVTNPLDQNVREATSYNRPDLIESIREYGIQDPIWVFENPNDRVVIDGKPRPRYTPLRGFSRRETLHQLLEMYPDGYKLEDGSVRRFDTVPVKLIDVTDPVTRLLLKIDHAEKRGLTRREVYNAFSQMYALQMTEKDMVVKLRSMLEGCLHYAPKRELPKEPSQVKDDGTPKTSAEYEKEVKKYENLLLAYYKGVIQKFKLIAQAPRELQELCLLTLDGKKDYPTNEELREGMDIFLTELSEDKTDSLSTENPGPKFRAWFQNLIEIKGQREAKGESNRGNSTAMMNAKQVDDLLLKVNAPPFKKLLKIIKRKVPIKHLTALDEMVTALWKTATPEMQKAFGEMTDDIVAESSPEAPAPEVKSEAPAPETPAQPEAVEA